MAISAGVREIADALAFLRFKAGGALPASHGSHGEEPDESRTIARLRQLHATRDPHTKLAAAVALAELAGDDQLLLGTLLESFEAQEESVRGAVLLAVGNLGPPRRQPLRGWLSP